MVALSSAPLQGYGFENRLRTQGFALGYRSAAFQACGSKLTQERWRIERR
jgi:hypothetical protein